MNRNFFCGTRPLVVTDERQARIFECFKGRRYVGFFAFLAVFTVYCATPGRALADEDEYSLYAQPSAGHWGANASDTRMGLALGAQLGLSPAANAVLEFGSSMNSDGSQASTGLQFGLSYGLDTFRVIPFIQILAGLEYQMASFTPSLSIGLGADYLINPSLSVGLNFRATPIDGLDISGIRHQLGLRISWHREL